MTATPDGTGRKHSMFLGALVPLLAFGTTLAGIALHDTGVQVEIQYAAAGGFLASCLLAYLAWTRLHKDIVALSTPIYGFLFLVTPIDYTAGVTLQLLYACGLTILTARLYQRFGAGTPRGFSATGLETGPLLTYIESTGNAFASLGPVVGHSAAAVFISFSEGEYRKAADLSHAASCRDGTSGPVVRAFGILRQHADLLDTNQPRPVTYLTFLPDDAALLARPLPVADDPDRAFETQMDNALLLLFSAAWHLSPKDRPARLVSQPFARKLLG
jgi:hypothetical protein